MTTDFWIFIILWLGMILFSFPIYFKDKKKHPEHYCYSNNESNQTFKDWFIETIKVLIIFFSIGFITIVVVKGLGLNLDTEIGEIIFIVFFLSLCGFLIWIYYIRKKAKEYDKIKMEKTK